MKQCTRCKESKPDMLFPRSSNTKDGFHSWCTSCMNGYRNQYHTCKIIQKHHDDLKDDPDRLSTQFIRNLVESVKGNEETL
jgi:hypothetical protein